MFTVKVVRKAGRARETELMACDAPRISHREDGGVAVYILGGRFDGQCLQVGGEPLDHVTAVSEIIIENANGKTTEIFRGA